MQPRLLGIVAVLGAIAEMQVAVVAQEPPTQVSTLKGLAALRVEVILWAPPQAPVTVTDLQQLMSQRLAEQGLAVDHGGDAAEPRSGDPNLTAIVMMVDNAPCAFRVRLHVSETAALAHDGGKARGKGSPIVRASTWLSPLCYSNASLDAQSCAKRVRDCVNRLLGNFAEDFRKANSQ